MVPRGGKADWIVNTVTGKREPMPDTEGAVWLDTDRIAYLTTKTVRAWDVAQREDHELGTRPDVANLVSLTPSPDHRWIAVIGRRTEPRPAGIVDSHYGIGVFDPLRKVWGPYFIVIERRAQ
jgi:hypothetical protein